MINNLDAEKVPHILVVSPTTTPTIATPQPLQPP